MSEEKNISDSEYYGKAVLWLVVGCGGFVFLFYNFFSYLQVY